MRVPNKYTSRLGMQDSTPIRPVRVEGVGPQAFGGGLGAGLNAIARGMRVVEERMLQAQTFDATARLNDQFEAFHQETVAARENADPGTTDHLKGRLEAFDKMRDGFLAKLPLPLQDRFHARLEAARKVVAAQELAFQLKSQEAHARQKLSETVVKTANAVHESPQQLEAAKASVYALIDEAPLSGTEKEAQKAAVEKALATAAYKAEVKRAVARAPSSAAGVIRQEEGFRASPYMDHHTSTGAPDKYRAGYGMDYVIRADGSKEKVTATTRVSRADAERSLAYHLEHVVYPTLKKQLQGVYEALPGRAKAALASVAFNYGSLPSSVVRAARGGDLKALAGAVERLGANKKRRKREAEVIRGTAAVDDDPRFASLSYIDRERYTAQAEREAAAAARAEAKAKADKQAEELSHTLLAIRAGEVGPRDVDKLAASGEWDYTAIHKMDAALKQYQKGAVDLAAAEQKLHNPDYVWDRTDPDDKKAQNLLFGSEGRAALQEGNVEYVSKTLLPRVVQSQDIPTKAVGMLAAMRSSSDPAKALFALRTLSQLRRASPDAFDLRTSDAVASDVQFFDSNKELMPTKELLERLRGGRTAAEQQSREALKKEAERLTRSADHAPDFAPEAVAGKFESLWNSLPFTEDVLAPSLPWVKESLSQDYRTLFQNEYVKWGDADKAKEAALKLLKRTWGPTRVGGQLYLMKYPPEQAGYRPGRDGTYSWITDQLRKEAGIKADAKIQLISDEQTAKELGHAPSYMVAVTQDGQTTLLTDKATGLPRRFNFKMEGEWAKKDAADFVARQKELEKGVFARLLATRLREGKPLDPETRHMHEEFVRKYGEREIEKAKKQLMPEVGQADPLTNPLAQFLNR